MPLAEAAILDARRVVVGLWRGGRASVVRAGAR